MLITQITACQYFGMADGRDGAFNPRPGQHIAWRSPPLRQPTGVQDVTIYKMDELVRHEVSQELKQRGYKIRPNSSRLKWYIDYRLAERAVQPTLGASLTDAENSDGNLVQAAEPQSAIADDAQWVWGIQLSAIATDGRTVLYRVNVRDVNALPGERLLNGPTVRAAVNVLLDQLTNPPQS